MGTAGRAVVFSGTTVAVGLLALVVLPLPFLRSMGYGGMLIPLVATGVAITLLPVILATVGPRMDRPHRAAATTPRVLAALVGGRRAPPLARGHRPVVVLGALACAATQPAPRQRRPRHDRQGGRAKQGLDRAARSGIGKGAITPVETLVAEPERPRSPPRRRASPACTAPRRRPRRLAPRGRAIVVAAPHQGDDAQGGRNAVQALRDAAHAASRRPASAAAARSTRTSSMPSTARSR